MPDKRLTILAIDDQEFDAETLHRYLSSIPGLDIDFLHCMGSEAALAELASRDVDVVFLDYLLGPDTGLDALKAIRESGDIRPVIAMTGQGNEYLATELMRAGADDYVVKSDLNPGVLKRAIETAKGQHTQRVVEKENRQLQARLREVNGLLEERNRRLEAMNDMAFQFVDNVSHEFRTPLTVIQEFASIIRDGLAGDVTDDQREYLDIIGDRVHDLTIMVNDMLDISRLEAGLFGVCRKVCRFADVLERVRTSLERKAAASKVTIELPDDVELPPLYCDGEKIGRVIINLTINAIKFTNEDGTVRLWTRYDAETSEIVVGVTDDGPGIAPDSLNAIFERFKQVGDSVRTSTKGFGLGLNIAKELVHLNLGDIHVASEVGRGSTFSFTVPTAQPSALIARYLQRIETFRSRASYLSLLVGHADPTADAASLDELEEFVAHQIRRSDLVFRTQPHRWLIVAASNAPGLESMIQRIQDAWAEVDRNRPDHSLPALDLHVKESRPIGEQAALVDSFEHEVMTMEPVHA